MLNYPSRQELQMLAITPDGKIYFLFCGKLYKVTYTTETYRGGFESTNQCTHCNSEVSVEMAKVGFDLACAGWTAEDLALIEDLARDWLHWDEDESELDAHEAYLWRLLNEAFMYAWWHHLDELPKVDEAERRAAARKYYLEHFAVMPPAEGWTGYHLY